jgi:hypothetical protein
MKAHYKKTAYDEFIEILEGAHESGRKITKIDVSKDEWNEILLLNANVKYMNSLKARTYVTDIITTCAPDSNISAVVRYHVLDHPCQQSVLAQQVNVIIL